VIVVAARFCRHSPGDRWFADETYLKVNGQWRYMYGAIDQYGQVIDVLVSPRRDSDAARRFFRRASAAGPDPTTTRPDSRLSPDVTPDRPCAGQAASVDRDPGTDAVSPHRPPAGARCAGSARTRSKTG
jgi:hypothetical protein